MVPVILYISKDKETTTKEIHRQMCKFVEIKISLLPSVRMDAGLLSEIDQDLVLKISRDHEGETFCLTCCESAAFVQILHIRSIFTDQRQRDSRSIHERERLGLLQQSKSLCLPLLENRPKEPFVT